MKNKHRPGRSAEFRDARRPHEPSRDRFRPQAPVSRPASPQDPNRGRGVWLYGVHPVLAALANPDRRAYRVVISGEAETTLGPRIATLAQEHSGMPRTEILPRDALERLLPRGAVHQGIAAQLDALEEPDIEDIVRRIYESGV